MIEIINPFGYYQINCMPKIITPNTRAPIKTDSGVNLIRDFSVSEKDNKPNAELGPLPSGLLFVNFK